MLGKKMMIGLGETVVGVLVSSTVGKVVSNLVVTNTKNVSKVGKVIERVGYVLISYAVSEAIVDVLKRKFKDIKDSLSNNDDKCLKEYWELTNEIFLKKEFTKDEEMSYMIRYTDIVSICEKKIDNVVDRILDTDVVFKYIKDHVNYVSV